MNRELVEILLSIFQKDKSTKGILCLQVIKRSSGCGCNVYPFECMKACNAKCHVCPLGSTHTIFNDTPHYLKHLIALMDRGNI